MDRSEVNIGLPSTISSDTVVELKAASNVDGCSSLAEGAAGTSKGGQKSLSEDVHHEKKAKPPPLEINSVQEVQELEAGARTPVSAPPISSDRTMYRGQKLKERKIGHRRVNEEGEITFKKIGTSVIMQSIQLGIGHAIGSLASKPERDVLMMDFTIVETNSFPSDGSNVTPAHGFPSFKFKTYAPLAFRYFRDLFGIAPDDFLFSLCNQPMRELSNPGASGSIFYLTSDDEFIIKTVQRGESEFLQKLLAGYFMNLNQNPRTLLPKFYGLYCYMCGNKNIRLIVMNNLLPSCIKLHEKYDLKGSTYKRKANKSERKKESPTYKDLDFIERHPEGILLEHDTYNALIKTMQRDCRVLESFNIMDYSLLVGIHNLDAARREKQPKDDEEVENASPEQMCAEKNDPSLVRSKSFNKQRLAAFSTTMEAIQAEVESTGDEKGDVPPGGIPAKNSKGESLLLFLGIIDILQSYKLAKKLEHTFKAFLHDGDTVSVHRPGFYSNRFLHFMGKTVFKKMPPTGQHRKFKTMVASVLALKHSPSKRKGTGVKKLSVDSKTNPKLQSASESTEDEDNAIPSSCERKSVSEDKLKSCANNECEQPPKVLSNASSSSVSKTSVTFEKREAVSLSQSTFRSEYVECESSSYSSTSVLGSSIPHPVTWTPPLSVEGSTPTHTEGTPSFTESSSSGDAACPTTPVKSINKSLDSLPPLNETQIWQANEMEG